MNFGEALNRAIINKGISKKHLAEMIGTTQSLITRYSKNKTVPKRDTVSKLEKALGLETESLQSIIDADKNYEVQVRKSKYETKRNDTETDILKAWKRGERTPYEVSEITGYSLVTVAKYLPVGGYE